MDLCVEISVEIFFIDQVLPINFIKFSFREYFVIHVFQIILLKPTFAQWFWLLLFG